MIKLENITKIYKGDYYETMALNEVSLSVSRGEFVVITGESGSGKTTLLNILGGMDRPTSGSYYIEDIAVHMCKAGKLDRIRKKYISFIFQYFALMNEYNVMENIEAPLIARNIPRTERKKRVKAAAQSMGIDALLDKYPIQISGGQKQRVALARALVVDCPILLADEPTGALDEENTNHVMAQFKLLHERGKTIILITHDKTVAAYADRVIKIKDGKLSQC